MSAPGMRRDGSAPALTRDDDALLDREYHRSLADAIRSAGGQWSGGEPWSRAPDLVAEAGRVGATALRVSLRDLSALDGVPGLWHVAVESDGAATLGPLERLAALSSLHLSVRGIRGPFDPVGPLPSLRWLTTGLGGKGGAGVLDGLRAGHATLEHLRVRETTVRSVGELVAGLPSLRSVSVTYADRLRSPGDLTSVAATLTELRLRMVAGLRGLDGIETAAALERVEIASAGVTDLRPLLTLPALREIDLTLAGGLPITDLDTLRRHIEGQYS